MNRKIMLKYKDDILKDIATLVSIPSVAGEPTPDAPNGVHCTQALNFLLDRARRMQFDTQNVANIAGHAQYGNGIEIAAVLTHVDVVAPGEGWTTDPFSATLIGRRLYGRGVADDKGAAVAALYCMKAIKDMGIKGTRRLRVIWGAAEETGMEDMKIYFKNQLLPSLAFSPDSEYGICNCEKGILRVKVFNPSPAGGMSLSGGRTVNAVPDTASLSFPCDESTFAALTDAGKKCAVDVLTERTDDGVSISARGRAAHAMNPEKGINAAAHLLKLAAQAVDITAFDPLLDFMLNKIGLETDGKSLRISFEDDVSGNLSVNLGLVRVDESCSELMLDIRYPERCLSANIIRKISAAAAEYGLKVEAVSDTLPLYVPENSRISNFLNDAHKSVTGKPAGFYSTGGGTYARLLNKKGVAFGPLFRDSALHNIHKANEFIDIDEFMIHCEICLEAMIRMIG